ncbi:MAG TPA: helix-turn-helix transcriptional regulator [Tepidisphaeraceae bacterium]|jgi:ribosome-binding protein aMBF1 (putative translation factor)
MNRNQSSIAQAKRPGSSKRTHDAVEILHRMVEDDAEMRELVERATINAFVAKLIYDARTKAGLTQKQLADLVGTKQPVIARLEDADYEGHSLSMLQRIATALHRRLEISLAPVKGAHHRA